MCITRAAALIALAGLAAGCTPSTRGTRAEAEHDGTTWVLADNVSHSPGVEGGVVLLWPRIIPSAETARLRPIAAAFQERLMGFVQEAFPGHPIDRRPEPERVCPPDGCLGASVGVLIGVSGESCYAVAILSNPGRSPQVLAPWVGTVTTSLEVPFREHPESHTQVTDFGACATLLDQASERDHKVRAAVQALRL